MTHNVKLGEEKKKKNCVREITFCETLSGNLSCQEREKGKKKQEWLRTATY